MCTVTFFKFQAASDTVQSNTAGSQDTSIQKHCWGAFPPQAERRGKTVLTATQQSASLETAPEAWEYTGLST